MNGKKKPRSTRPFATRFERTGETPTTFTGRPVFGAFVPFAAPTATTADGWIVLAYAVTMKTSKVALARSDFEDCVRNFQAYPCCPVTIEHADTADDPFGALPKEWKEPNGHIEALRVGTMTRTVGSQTQEVATLEGRPSYEASVADDVGATKKWRFGSITILQDAIDEETGAKLGSMLWSWSLTAHPRLTGLPALAASKRLPEGTVVQAGYWWGDIDSREDLISCLRELFDLPVTSTEAEILAELDKLEGLATGEGDTSGIDVDHLVGQIRDALRLPALTTTAEVMAEVRKGLTVLPSETMPASNTSLSHRGAAAVPKEKTMKFTELAAALKVPQAESLSEEGAEKAVLALARDGLTVRTTLALTLDASLASPLAELVTARAELPAVKTELARVSGDLKARLDAEAQAEAARMEKELVRRVDEVCLAKGYGDDVKPALLAYARTDRAGFDARYPAPSVTELAQRAQDPVRFARLPTAPNPPASSADPGATPDLADEVEALQAFAAQHGESLTTLEAFALLHAGETLTTYAARLGVRAA